MRDKRPEVIAALATAEILAHLLAAREAGGAAEEMKTTTATRVGAAKRQGRNLSETFARLELSASPNASATFSPMTASAYCPQGRDQGADRRERRREIDPRQDHLRRAARRCRRDALRGRARRCVVNPRAARRLGIGMVFQHFSLFEPMTVLENIAIGMDHALDRRRLEREVRAVLDAYALPLDIHRHVDTLSVGERQRIEIVRCLLQKPKLLDHGRADLGPDAAGGRAALRHLAQARGRRLHRALHQPQAERDQGAVRQRDDPAGRAGRGRMRSAGRDAAPHCRDDDRRRAAPMSSVRAAARRAPRASSSSA